MATIVGNGSKGHHKFTLNVNEVRFDNTTNFPYNVDTNTSKVFFDLILSPIQGGWDWAGWGSKITYSTNIGGHIFSGTIPNYDGYSSVTIASGTVEIPHNDDGTKKIHFSFSVNDSTGQSYTCGNASASGEMTLTVIPRASSIAATDAYIESASLINITRASATFTHTVSYDFLGITETIATKTSETTLSLILPASFYEKIPNAKSGKCTLSIETYSGNTKIGDTKTCEITCTCDYEKCKPTLDVAIEDINVTCTALTGSVDKLIKFFSNVAVAMTTTAKNGATMTAQRCLCGDGKAIDKNGTINNIESGKFTISATDSRGFTNTIEITKEIVEYIKLTSNLEITRPIATEGIINLKFNGNYFKSSFGSVANNIIAKYRYRNKQDNGQFCDWINLPIVINETDDKYTINHTSNDVFLYDKTFEIGNPCR